MTEIIRFRDILIELTCDSSTCKIPYKIDFFQKVKKNKQTLNKTQQKRHTCYEIYMRDLYRNSSLVWDIRYRYENIRYMVNGRHRFPPFRVPNYVVSKALRMWWCSLEWCSLLFKRPLARQIVRHFSKRIHANSFSWENPWRRG